MAIKQSITMYTKFCTLLFGALLFFTPLIFVTNTNELFEFPKMSFVYILGSSIIFLFIVSIILKHTPWHLPSVLVSFFVLSNIISTLLSTHRYTSLWGYYTRFNDGLVSVLVLFGLYLFIKSMYDAFNLKRFVEHVSLLTLLPLSLYGIAQHFGFFIPNQARVYTSFGQPNWFAAYLGMLLPIIIYKIITKSYFLHLQLGLFILYILGFSALWFTYSLSGILGFVTSFLLTLALSRDYLVSSKRKITLLLIFTLVICLACPGIFLHKITDAFTDLKDIIALETHVYAQDTTHKVSDPGFIRTGIWKGTLKLILASSRNFFIGIGPETFPYQFQQYRPASLNYSSEWDFILNKPHNYYLEVFAELGLIGFVFYVGMLLWVLRKGHPVITPVLVSLYATNFFSWPTVSTSLLFWVWLAILEESA